MEHFEFICHVFIHVSIFVQPTREKISLQLKPKGIISH